MSASVIIRNVVCRAASSLVAIGALLAPPAAAQTTTFAACYVPSVGAMYLIKRTGLPTICLSTAHVEVSWTEGGVPPDGSITTIKLADGAVTTAKIGAGTSVDLLDGLDASAFATAAHNHDAQYFTEAELQAAGVINTVGNPVDWTKLKGVPAGFADGVDDGAAFTASQGITISGTDIQLASCAATQMWKRNASGTAWECAADANSGGTVTSLTAGTGLTGGTITTSGTVSVSFAGPGAATTVARSDHMHQVAGGGTAVGDGALFNNTTGLNNTAVGLGAMANNTTASNNTAVGFDALVSNSTGETNTAVGAFALFSNTASRNTAVGHDALGSNTSGADNTALGAGALGSNTSGNFNTAVGQNALRNSLTGNSIALGAFAGFNVTAGDRNIFIGNVGVGGDDRTIRIGDVQSRTFIAGISGIAVSSGDAVFVNASGQLGIAVSSARFKEAVADLGEASRRLLRLRPVQFHYKPGYDDGSRLLQYGLIAEEVAEVFPELVLYGPTGGVETVRYHLLAPLLLNELQRQERELVALRQVVEELRAELRSRQR